VRFNDKSHWTKKGQPTTYKVPKVVHKRITGKIRDIIACRIKNTTTKNIQKNISS